MIFKFHTITCQFCGNVIPEDKVEKRRLRVPGVKRKQTVHSTDCCTLLDSQFNDTNKKRQNCYRRHQDFLKKLEVALQSDDPSIRRFARMCQWKLIERKPSKLMNEQIKQLKSISDEELHQRFRKFWKKPMELIVK